MPSDLPKQIIVSGLIGVGKTTLVKSLSKISGYCPIMEQTEENPHLYNFYQDPQKYAYVMQEHLTRVRFREHQFVRWALRSKQIEGAVFDRSVWECSIFARINYELGNIEQEVYNTFLSGVSEMSDQLEDPDLIIYLRAEPETCLERVVQRNRSAETNGKFDREELLDYLCRLDETYQCWIRKVSARVQVMTLSWETFQSVSTIWDMILAQYQRNDQTKSLFLL